MKDRTETDDAATARLALDMWFDDREFLGMDAKVQMVETTETDLVTGYRTYTPGDLTVTLRFSKQSSGPGLFP